MTSEQLPSTKDDEVGAKEILDQQPLPPEIAAVTIEMKEDYSGVPALYLSFQVQRQLKLEDDQILRLSRYMLAVQDRMLRSGISRFPYASLGRSA